MNQFLAAIKKYADFSGRASRSDYWMFILVFSLVYFGLVVLSMVLPGELSTVFLVLSYVFYLGLLIPMLALIARRLHDSDRSGWMMLISLVPILGGLYLLYLLCIEGTPGDNRFGSSPLAMIPNAV